MHLSHSSLWAHRLGFITSEFFIKQEFFNEFWMLFHSIFTRVLHWKTIKTNKNTQLCSVSHLQLSSLQQAPTSLCGFFHTMNPLEGPVWSASARYFCRIVSSTPFVTAHSVTKCRMGVCGGVEWARAEMSVCVCRERERRVGQEGVFEVTRGSGWAGGSSKKKL